MLLPIFPILYLIMNIKICFFLYSKFLWILFTFFWINLGYSQNRMIDSLNTALKNHKTRDTTRVSILNYLAFSHYNYDPPKAMVFVDEALAISKEVKSEVKIAHSYYIKAIVFTGQSNFKEALNNYDKAIK